MPPPDRQIVARLGCQSAAPDADRVKGFVMDFTPCDLWSPLVEQTGDCTHDPRLALPAFAEHDQIVSGEQRRFQLRQHGVIEPDNAWERRPPGTQPGQYIFPKLLFDAAW
jgi:hypothetical protein